MAGKKDIDARTGIKVARVYITVTSHLPHQLTDDISPRQLTSNNHVTWSFPVAPGARNVIENQPLSRMLQWPAANVAAAATPTTPTFLSFSARLTGQYSTKLGLGCLVPKFVLR